MSDKPQVVLFLKSTLKSSLNESSYITTEEIARIIVEVRGPEDASAIAHWIQENGHNKVESN